MAPTPRALAPYLLPGERVVWADRPRQGLLRRMGLPPRTPGAVLLAGVVTSAAAFAVGLALATSPEPARVALVLGLALLTCALATALAWRRAVRSAYAATDRGRGFLVEGGEVVAFTIPARIEVRASRDLETGDLDLGTLQVQVHPGGRVEPRPIRLRAVGYPCIVAELIQGLAPTPAPGPAR